MALIRSNTYPGRFVAPSVNYPQGAFKNRSSPTAEDGSYLEAAWANDWDGFFARILNVASVTPNGNVDTGSSSQLFDAMIAAVKLNLGTAATKNVGTSAGQIPDRSSFNMMQNSIGLYASFPQGLILQSFEVNVPGNDPAGYLFTLPTSFTTLFSAAVLTPDDPFGDINISPTYVKVGLGSLRIYNPSAGINLVSVMCMGY